MRQEWQRPTAEVGLDNDAVAELVRPALPDTPVTGFEILVGGLANPNVKVPIAGRRTASCCAYTSAISHRRARKRRSMRLYATGFRPLGSSTFPRRTWSRAAPTPSWSGSKASGLKSLPRRSTGTTRRHSVSPWVVYSQASTAWMRPCQQADRGFLDAGGAD